MIFTVLRDTSPMQKLLKALKVHSLYSSISARTLRSESCSFFLRNTSLVLFIIYNCITFFKNVPGLRRLESSCHSRQRCERCMERSFSQLTVRRPQKTMTRSCSDNTNGHHHNHCFTIHSLHHNSHHNPSARVHSLDTPKVTKHTSGCMESAKH